LQEKAQRNSKVAHRFGFRAQVTIGGGNDANVYFAGALFTDAFQLSFLKNSQQLGLHVEWYLANLIEEQGTAIRQFDSTDSIA
jgi:hypothetical protein